MVVVGDEDGVPRVAVPVVVGAAVSTVQVRVSSGPAFPAASTMRTLRVWLPSASVGAVYGDGQAAQAPPSSWHS